MADLGQGHPVRTIGVGQAPSDMVNSADGTALFVTLRRDDALGVIDTIEGRLRARVAVERRPVHVYLHPAGDTIWVGNDLSGSVSVVDVNDLEVRANVRTGNGHRKVAFTPDGDLACVTNIADGTVSLVDCRTYAVLDDVPSGGRGPHGIDYSILSGRMYVCNGRDGTVGIIDPRARKLVRSIRVGKNAQSVHFTHDGRYGYVSNGGEARVTVIDASDDSIATTVDVGAGPDAVAFSSDDRRAYVAGTRTDSLSVIDVTTHTPIANVPVGSAGSAGMHRQVAISRYGEYVSVPNPEEATVSVVSTRELRVVATLAVGDGCGAMCFVGPREG